MLLYIDPGTGSMLFTILLGILGIAVYSLRAAFVKIRFILSGGRAERENPDRASIVIFSDTKRYWNIFEPICGEFERRGEKLEYLTASADDPALSARYEHVACKFIGEGNQAYAFLNTLHADIVLSSTPSLEVFYWKRSKHVKWYVHIPHAVSDLTMYRMFGIDYYDAILISGEHHIRQVRTLEKLRNLPEKELVMTGLTYIDRLKDRFEKAGPLPEHPFTVLLAPSWGSSAIFSVYGGEIIKKLLETGYHVIVRPHPQSFTAEKELIDSIMKEYPENEQLEWNRDNDNFEVLRRSDILISDFSGVIFDFALVFDKPVIYTEISYDKSPYDACWLDEEPWTFQILPEIGIQLTKDRLENLKELIRTCISDSRFEEGREKARSQTWAYPGEGTQRTVDYLLNKRNDLTKNKANEHDNTAEE